MNHTKNIFCLMAMCGIQLAHADNHERTRLDEIKVQAKSNDSTTVFTEAGAKSDIDHKTIARSHSLDSVVRALPGSFTHMDTAQATLNVNIRGMTGLGRVNTMIDGVPQTLFGITSSSEGGETFHQSTRTSTSAFGVAVEPNFLAGIDIRRGSHATGGVNTLMGSADFRTIDIDDIITDKNKNAGLYYKHQYGNNQFGYSGMLAVAGRHQTQQAGEIGAMLAFSSTQKSTNYKQGGANGKFADSNDYVTAQKQKPQSYLAKLAYGLDAHKLVLSGREYNINSGGRSLKNSALTAHYQYNPESDFANINIMAAATKNIQRMNEGALAFTLENASTTNHAHYLNVNNTSHFYPSFADIRSTYGISYHSNDYQRQADIQDDNAFTHTPFAPSGKQQIVGYYINNHLEKDIYQLDLNLNYVNSQFSGIRPKCDKVITCFPKEETRIQKEQNNLNAKIQVSAHLNDWLQPFASYALTSRMPNIQEVFLQNEGGDSVNPFLKSETAKIAEIGINGLKKGVFTEQDALGFKALYFHNRIDNYIHNQAFFLTKDKKLSNNIDDMDSDADGGFKAIISVNSLTPVTIKGYELQASYHNDRLFATFAYTHSQSNQPVNVNSGFEDFGFSGGAATDLLPKNYWTLGLGGYFLDNKLELGSEIRFYGQNFRLRPDGIDVDTSNYHLEAMPKSPMVTDLYTSYQLSKNTLLKARIENVFNKSYIHPLNVQNSTSEQYDVDDNDNDVYTYTNYARGRTLSVGIEIRF